MLWVYYWPTKTDPLIRNSGLEEDLANIKLPMHGTMCGASVEYRGKKDSDHWLGLRETAVSEYQSPNHEIRWAFDSDDSEDSDRSPESPSWNDYSDTDETAEALSQIDYSRAVENDVSETRTHDSIERPTIRQHFISEGSQEHAVDSFKVQRVPFVRSIDESSAYLDWTLLGAPDFALHSDLENRIVLNSNEQHVLYNIADPPSCHLTPVYMVSGIHGIREANLAREKTYLGSRPGQDMFKGHAYVVPLGDTLEQIKIAFGTQNVRIFRQTPAASQDRALRHDRSATLPQARSTMNCDEVDEQINDLGPEIIGEGYFDDICDLGSELSSQIMSQRTPSTNSALTEHSSMPTGSVTSANVTDREIRHYFQPGPYGQSADSLNYAPRSQISSGSDGNCQAPKNANYRDSDNSYGGCRSRYRGSSRRGPKETTTALAASPYGPGQSPGPPSSSAGRRQRFLDNIRRRRLQRNPSTAISSVGILRILQQGAKKYSTTIPAGTRRLPLVEADGLNTLELLRAPLKPLSPYGAGSLQQHPLASFNWEYESQQSTTTQPYQSTSPYAQNLDTDFTPSQSSSRRENKRGDSSSSGSKHRSSSRRHK
ncbi:hypothetical protein CSAL01_07069 [Colletotrichum salicis]|uniref:Uncharacterized protein n=1 Tax=Colletotrichum salicis TaxID=1209931 RepID=A0A135UJ65_9PEZI|nr:hypothetical protein CSAL01_07069 [Colletotrichum salicis]